tara:strand:+ start:284 stop:499 length:216 start_codon:yes stop_codon:yes gene_type:complete
MEDKKRETILIWIDKEEKMYEVDTQEWSKHRHLFDHMEGGYSEHPKATHKDWRYAGINEIEKLLNYVNQNK